MDTLNADQPADRPTMHASRSHDGLHAPEHASAAAPKDDLWLEHHAVRMLMGALLFVVCYFGAAAAVLRH